ncbi:MAG: hypothetical protein C5S48_07955 [Candidatus Methanogaster sp.]|nr:MAG: hypothetical protein C5S48_07955 [ANME-2 cluster archaeon]
MQNIKKTIRSILKKFETPDDYEKRKIVFWYDKDETADDEELEIIKSALAREGIKLHRLNNNFFATKKLLEKDDTESNYLIYSRGPEREYESNWLLDIQLYSSRFENSKVSDIKSELGIEGYDLDKFLEANSRFFASKKRVSAFKQFYQKDWKEGEFVLGILAVLSGSSTIDLKEILRRLLVDDSLDEGDKRIWHRIEKYGLVNYFWDIVKRDFKYSFDNPTLKKLFLSFIITHIDRNTTVSLKPYEHYISKKSNECEIFLRGWMYHSKDSASFDKHCQQLLSENGNELEIDLTSMLNKHDVEDYIEAESIDILDKNIIRNIVQELNSDMDNFDRYLNLIEKRKRKHWYPQYKNIYSALENAVRLHQFSKELEHDGIKEQSLNELFKGYTSRYYLMDCYYRKFYYHYDPDNEKEILKKDIKIKVEKLYKQMLDTLLGRWDELIDSEPGDVWNIELIDNQDKFYEIYVHNIIRKNDRNKVAVIISDALRYETAAELQHVLNKNTKGTIELKAMAGSLPSYTKLGMASLLPHKRLEYRNKHLFVDGIDSGNTVNREKILLNGSPGSVTFKLRDLMDPRIEEAREKIKGKRVVYIYHNKIDATGDEKSSEHDVFNAVESTIQDIYKMIDRLGRSLNATNIIVTSDHGFLYQREQLENVDKLETSDFDKIKIIESNKRFILSEQDMSLPNTHKFSMATIVDSDKPMHLYVPLSDLRFKSQGGGVNYVHGGASLQEIVIPVLVYNHNRQNVDLDRKGIKHGKVNVSVINPNRKIASSPFKVKLLQTEKVTAKLEPLKCKVALWDMGKDERKVSDERLIIADSASDEPEERVQSVVLSLSSDIENRMYYLRAIDDNPEVMKKDIFNPIPFEVDLLIVDDF